MELLSSGHLGRLGVIVAGRPEIFPINYALHEGNVLFRTGSGIKFDAANGNQVCFEADGFDPQTRIAWSVMVSGVATEIARLHELLELLQVPVFPWEPGAKPHMVQIEPEQVTGRRFSAVDLLGDFVTQPGSD
ncbi:pyridoxamine 5'-phosphate oxidase family protein [Flexivirga caeni]|uniref:Pyridoxamine 5'-phosphate oxidase family protein n=2 Tax=Flexivirga caeni TaxID=2294115 RepID=A0A3M9M1X3_9MICO|nr:pyridoxamine 5'-phosphate oxidase family protein [Flexivirga caeni]